MSARPPTAAEQSETPPDLEPVWSLWFALGFLVLQFALTVVIPFASLSIAALLRQSASSEAEIQTFIKNVQASQFVGMGVLACQVLAWMITFRLLRTSFQTFSPLALRRALGIRLPKPEWVLYIAGPIGMFLLFGGTLIEQSLAGPETASGFDDLMATLAGRVAVSILAVLVAPIAEEVFFRGLLYPPMARVLPPAAAVLLNGTIFALAHVAAYELQLAFLLPVLLLGTTLAAMRATTGSVVPGMIAHAVFNATSLALYFLSPT